MDVIGKLKDNKNEVIVSIYRSTAFPRKQSFRIHHHIAFELGYIEKGNGIYKSDKTFEIKEGDFFVFKPNKAHCITDILGKDMQLINIHINPQYFRFMRSIYNTEDNFGIKFLSHDFISDKISDFIPESSRKKIIENIDRLVSEFTDKKINYIYKAETLLNDIIIELSRYQLKRDSEYTPSTKSSDDIFRTVEYINEHYSDNLNLTDLAEIAHLTKTYYSHIFKNTVGLSVWEYISIKRIDHALFELRNTDKNIIDIALSCGFNNTANFNKLFKKYTGSLPKNFKNR